MKNACSRCLISDLKLTSNINCSFDSATIYMAYWMISITFYNFYCTVSIFYSGYHRSLMISAIPLFDYQIRSYIAFTSCSSSVMSLPFTNSWLKNALDWGVLNIFYSFLYLNDKICPMNLSWNIKTKWRTVKIKINIKNSHLADY